MGVLGGSVSRHSGDSSEQQRLVVVLNGALVGESDGEHSVEGVVGFGEHGFPVDGFVEDVAEGVDGSGKGVVLVGGRRKMAVQSVGECLVDGVVGGGEVLEVTEGGVGVVEGCSVG